MIYRLLILALSFISSPSFGQTQSEMARTAQNNYLKADKELNSTYQQVLKAYKADAAFIKNLKTAQMVWIKFRDAELKMKYPDRKAGYYGSSFPMCRSIYLTDLTNQRITTLKQWLTGMAEGDVCNGSIKNSN